MAKGIKSSAALVGKRGAGKILAMSVAAAALAFVPAISLAQQDDYVPTPNALSLSPSTDRVASDAVKAPGEAEELPRYFDAAPPAAEQPNIHGFFSSPFKTAYVTPRGLVVQDKGVVWQPIVGLVFPLGDFGPLKNVAFVGGIWNSVDSYEAGANPQTGPWDEMDTFASFSGTVGGVVSLNLTYGEWNSPEHAFTVEHNLDLKVGYDDSKLWGSSGFALNPYVDLWWAISGSSTVILGRHGGTGYIEPGIAPSFTIKEVTDYPLTITVPMYVSISDAGYWDETRTFSSSILGLASISVNGSVPLSFIPTRYGHWHLDAGVTYDYLINDALLHAGTLASGNTNHNVVIGSLGFGVNF